MATTATAAASSPLSDKPAENADILNNVFGWRITLEQLYLEAMSWQSIRTLHLIRGRQLKEELQPPVNPAATVQIEDQEIYFNLARLPAEVYERIVVETRRAAISHARTQFPFKAPPTCFCRSRQTREKAILKERRAAAESQWKAYISARKRCTNATQWK